MKSSPKKKALSFEKAFALRVQETYLKYIKLSNAQRVIPACAGNISKKNLYTKNRKLP